jgi:hypothetical protein
MSAIIVQILQLLATFLPRIIAGASAAEVTNIIGIIEQAVPLAVDVGEALAQPIRNMITALRSSGVVTPAQLDQLDTQEAALDAAFDTATAAATAQDAGP